MESPFFRETVAVFYGNFSKRRRIFSENELRSIFPKRCGEKRYTVCGSKIGATERGRADGCENFEKEMITGRNAEDFGEYIQSKFFVRGNAG